MSSKYKMNNPEGIYFLSTAVVNWIDVFTRILYKEIVIESLKYCVKNKGMMLYGYVIMTNHIHLIIGRRPDGSAFADMVRDFKKFTSSQILNAIQDNPQEGRKEWMIWMMERAAQKNSNNTNFQFWQQDNHPIELEGDWIEQKLEYVHKNPVEAGFVREPEEYRYSSASNYAGKGGLVEVISVYDGEEI
ncbi:REP-associated tyrosine transposase [Ekhidna sp.]